MPRSLRIGQLADRVGVTAKAIRYYEQRGLIREPERSQGGYRLYREADEERLRFVATARRLGFSLGEVAEILALRDRGQPPCGYVRETIGRRLEEIDRRVADLRKMRRELAALDAQIRTLPSSPGAGRYCHVIESSTDVA